MSRFFACRFSKKLTDSLLYLRIVNHVNVVISHLNPNEEAQIYLTSEKPEMNKNIKDEEMSISNYFD